MSLPLNPSTFPIATNTKWRIETIATEKVAPIKTSNKLEFQRMRNGGFWNRKWHMMDVANLLLVIGTHGLALSAPFVFNASAVWVAFVLSLMTGIGMTLGYHRLLTHKSLKLPKWLEYCFTYCGCHSGQKDPIFWVSVHKNHHKYTDQERDPHSPREGFWFSHIGWLLYSEYLAMKCGEPEIGVYSNVPELKAQWFYRFLHDTYVWHIIGLGVLLYLVGGYPYLAWGMGARIVMVDHFSFIVGPVCHLWGGRPYNTKDTSTNNGPPVGRLEHHVEETSPRRLLVYLSLDALSLVDLCQDVLVDGFLLVDLHDVELHAPPCSDGALGKLEDRMIS
ncbi:hypothetical protein E3N88_09987 [Mikania micrantha]|uniref:Fatty acid desaturase domain-containing protein n=1 Tax=Mikania micrantha TaxID=192012 RepID=A0A5N6PC20_9ASTR|nr:hypothetical protein E3N88_09987 [Mikania micrantha]